MSAFVLRVSGNKEEILRKFFDLIDLVRNDSKPRLSETEKELLVLFYILPERFANYRFSPQAKHAVRELYKERGKSQSIQNLNNKIYSLMDKGFLSRNENTEVTAKPWLEMVLSKIIYAFDNNDVYDIKFRFGHDTSQS